MLLKKMTSEEIAVIIDGRHIGSDLPITGIARIEEAKPGDITFFF